MELPVTVISSEIKRGCILHSNDFDKIDHGKFFAIIGEDGDNVVGAFFINSKINSFIFSKPKMLNLQYLLSCRKYTFLNYDSYLCCSKMITMNKSSLIKGLSDRRTTIKGELVADDLENILQMVRSSDIYTELEKEIFFK
ncbi:MAG: hypothetical protein J6V33_05540 [Bacteroidales bacterium]|jgi:hypothetical protein|nr:hypothetical protein [Bacteroidales bacterium]